MRDVHPEYGLHGERRESLYGGGGNDILSGGPGQDSLSGDPGADTLNGGTATDACSTDDADVSIVSCN